MSDNASVSSKSSKPVSGYQKGKVRNNILSIELSCNYLSPPTLYHKGKDLRNKTIKYSQ